MSQVSDILVGVVEKPVVKMSRKGPVMRLKVGKPPENDILFDKNEQEIDLFQLLQNDENLNLPTVVAIGSLTWPPFREKGQMLDRLASKYLEYGVKFSIIYTAEANQSIDGRNLLSPIRKLSNAQLNQLRIVFKMLQFIKSWQRFQFRSFTITWTIQLLWNSLDLTDFGLAAFWIKHLHIIPLQWNLIYWL